MLQEWHYFFQNTLRWRNLRKITIAQVHGDVYAAGLIALMGDYGYIGVKATDWPNPSRKLPQNTSLSVRLMFHCAIQKPATAWMPIPQTMAARGAMRAVAGIAATGASVVRFNADRTFASISSRAVVVVISYSRACVSAARQPPTRLRS